MDRKFLWDDIKDMPTQEWGPPAWTTIHALAYAWTEERKQLYMDLMNNFLLPCPKCTRERDKLMVSSMSARLGDINSVDDAKRWTFDLHNLVNARLGKRIMTPESAAALWDNHYQDLRMIQSMIWYIQKVISKFANNPDLTTWIHRIIQFIPFTNDTYRSAIISYINDHPAPIGKKYMQNLRAWSQWNQGWIGLYNILMKRA